MRTKPLIKLTMLAISLMCAAYSCDIDLPTVIPGICDDCDKKLEEAQSDCDDSCTKTGHAGGFATGRSCTEDVTTHTCAEDLDGGCACSVAGADDNPEIITP